MKIGAMKINKKNIDFIIPPDDCVVIRMICGCIFMSFCNRLVLPSFRAFVISLLKALLASWACPIAFQLVNKWVKNEERNTTITPASTIVSRGFSPLNPITGVNTASKEDATRFRMFASPKIRIMMKRRTISSSICPACATSSSFLIGSQALLLLPLLPAHYHG